MKQKLGSMVFFNLLVLDLETEIVRNIESTLARKLDKDFKTLLFRQLVLSFHLAVKSCRCQGCRREP